MITNLVLTDEMSWRQESIDSSSYGLTFWLYMFEWTPVAISSPSSLLNFYVLSSLHRCLMGSDVICKRTGCVGAVIELPDSEEDLPVNDDPVFILG